MLTDIKPYLKNVAYGYAIPSDNTAKNAFPIPGEAALVTALGEPYKAYMRRTERLIPFLF
jgi:hypothetical protein